jgi:hypothetical protein
MVYNAESFYSTDLKFLNRIFWRLLIAFGFSLTSTCWGCSNANHDKLSKEDTTYSQRDTAIVKDNTQLPVKSIALNTISPIPDTIDGCGDYYMYDSVDIASKEYIFLSRMSEIAVISLNSEILYLNIDTLASETTKSFIRDVYTGNNIKAILNVRKTAQYEEGAYYKGQLIIIKGSERKIFKVHGTSGC